MYYKFWSIKEKRFKIINTAMLICRDKFKSLKDVKKMLHFILDRDLAMATTGNFGLVEDPIRNWEIVKFEKGVEVKRWSVKERFPYIKNPEDKIVVMGYSSSRF